MSPIEQVIHGWELTRQWMAQDMAELRQMQAQVRALLRGGAYRDGRRA